MILLKSVALLTTPLLMTLMTAHHEAWFLPVKLHTVQVRVRCNGMHYLNIILYMQVIALVCLTCYGTRRPAGAGWRPAFGIEEYGACFGQEED